MSRRAFYLWVVAVWMIQAAAWACPLCKDALVEPGQRAAQSRAARGYALSRFLARGDRGAAVTALQKFLIAKEYLQDAATGTFGSGTEQALIAYQTDAGIIGGPGDPGAGIVGPATLARYHRDLRQSLMSIVRARGWEAM